MTDRTGWPHSQLLGRPLERSELDESGLYMTIHVGGPLDGDVALLADIEARRVSVVARWGSGTPRREVHAGELPMGDAEALAAQWADELGAGREPGTT